MRREPEGCPRRRPCRGGVAAQATGAGRRLRGNAMLELILILPLYMLLLFVVCALSEFGQVSTQAYLTARNLAWARQANGDEPAKTVCAPRVDGAFSHFGVRVVTQTTDDRMLVPLREDGTEGGGTRVNNHCLVKAGAHAFAHYGLPDPLYPVAGVYTANADGANLAGLARAAMRGSDQAPHDHAVPWLRRHYASVWVTYKAFGGVFGLQTRLRCLHTVLRGAAVNTQDHAPYTIGGRPGTLRDCPAYDDTKIVSIPRHNHQLDLLGLETDFEPDKP